MNRPSRQKKRPARFEAGSVKNLKRRRENIEVEMESANHVENSGHNMPTSSRAMVDRNTTKRRGTEKVDVIYRILRRSIGTLTTKMDEISKEVRINKQAQVNQNLEVPQNIENLVVPTEYREQTISSPREESSLPSNKTLVGDETNDGRQRITYLIKNVNTEKPKFGGHDKDNCKIHPVTFLEDLEFYLGRVPKEGHEIDFILECLVDDARDWARIYKNRWTGFSDFKNDFLATYWGENEQNELRRNIVNGVWDRNKTPSMLNYFLKIVGKAQALSFAIPENQIVSDIIRHYPKYVQQGWFTNKLSTIMETAELLRKLDSIKDQEMHTFTFSNQGRELQKKKLDYRKEYYNKWQKPVNQSNSANKRTINTIDLSNVTETVN